MTEQVKTTFLVTSCLIDRDWPESRGFALARRHFEASRHLVKVSYSAPHQNDLPLRKHKLLHCRNESCRRATDDPAPKDMSMISYPARFGFRLLGRANAIEERAQGLMFTSKAHTDIDRSHLILGSASKSEQQEPGRAELSSHGIPG